MLAIHLRSDYSSLTGYYTGKLKKTKEVPFYDSMRCMSEVVNIPVLCSDIYDKSVKTYVKISNAEKAVNLLVEKLKEPIPDSIPRKPWEDGFCHWRFAIVDIETGRVVKSTN